ncbi:MAG: hypothetical protein E6G94_07355 [Alphaproteobacteria bacterium]|nr:MAG: hypothetical protein E6G94_07355 [Alphaproteobacteria bacterium]
MKQHGLIATLVLAGCASAPATRPAVRAEPVERPSTFSTLGLQQVVGHNARTLEGLFGKPDLDVREGAARKLQFRSPVCVLDAYLYPPRSGAEPLTTYLDARLPDGRDFDRASCVAALGKRQQAR